MKSKLILILCLLSSIALSKEAKTIRLSDKETAKIFLTFGKTTVLSFPAKPEKVILGTTGLFAIEYVVNDIAIAPITTHSTTNLFVYLEGRRFSFDLNTTKSNTDSILLVRDALPKEKSK